MGGWKRNAHVGKSGRVTGHQGETEAFLFRASGSTQCFLGAEYPSPKKVNLSIVVKCFESSVREHLTCSGLAQDPTVPP